MVVALDDLWGRDATRTQEQLRAAASWDDRFAIVEAALGRRHEAGRAVDPEVAFAWRQMVTSRGRVRVDQLAAELGWSRKRLWSRFRSQIGLTQARGAAGPFRPRGPPPRRWSWRRPGGGRGRLRRPVPPPPGRHGLRRVTPTAVAVAPWLAVDDVAWAGGRLPITTAIRLATAADAPRLRPARSGAPRARYLRGGSRGPGVHEPRTHGDPAGLPLYEAFGLSTR